MCNINKALNYSLIIFIYLFVFVIVFLPPSFGYCQDSDIEIDGLIIDQTQTKIGRDFYDYFYAKWEAPLFIKNYNIYVKERPLPKMGSWIFIEAHEQQVFRQVLRPRAADIEESAKKAAEYVHNFLLKYEEMKKELGNDDMQGDGIH